MFHLTTILVTEILGKYLSVSLHMGIGGLIVSDEKKLVNHGMF